MDKIVIIGGGGHAKVVVSIVKKMCKFEICGYTDKVNQGNILGIEYLGTDIVLENLYSNEGVKQAALGIGQLTDSSCRREIANEIVRIGYSFPAIVSPNAVINENVEIAEGTVVMDGVVINTCVKIGRFCIINTSSSIDHDCLIGNFTHIAPGVVLSGGVVLGDNVLIGTGATIIQYKTITDDAIIGAGALVLKNIYTSSSYGGVPARLLRE